MSQNNQPKRNNPSSAYDKNHPSSREGGSSIHKSTEEELLRNVPPHSIESEQAVLGGVFLNPDAMFSVADVLVENDFYLPAHRHIYGAFVALRLKDLPVDLIMVGEYLKSHSLLEVAGGAVYLAELAKSVISAANIEHHAEIVKNKALVRNLITSCADIISNSYDTTNDIQELLNDSQQTIFNLAQRSATTTYSSSGALTDRILKDLIARAERKESITGVATGYRQLDEMTAGLQPTDLIILAARPAMGKTAFALNLAMRAAIGKDVPVIIYSLEMGMDQLLMRMMCAWGKIDLSMLRRSRLTDDDWQKLYDVVPLFEQAPIYIDDTPALTPLEMRARTRRLKAERGVGLVIVDYLQLMRSSKRIDSREQEISDISRNLKAMAKELNVPVIALSQLNRKVEERSDKRPLLSDLRESGAIEQDADIIMFIHRPAAYLKAEERPPVDEAEIIIGKHRNGPVGTVRLLYSPQFTAFEDPSAVYHPATDL